MSIIDLAKSKFSTLRGRYTLQEAIDDVPPPPCDSCSWHDYCKINAKACFNFQRYVELGRTTEPWPTDSEPPNLRISVDEHC